MSKVNNSLFRNIGSDSVKPLIDGKKIRVASTNPGYFLQLYHDGGHARIQNSIGHNYLDAKGANVFNSDSGQTTFQDFDQSVFSILVDTFYDHTLFSLSDTGDNLLILSNTLNSTKNHDHGLQVDPTFFVHSDTDVDSFNDEWLSLKHNKTDGVISVGSGGIILENANSFVGNANSTPTPPVTLTTPGQLAFWTFSSDVGSDQQDLWCSFYADASTSSPAQQINFKMNP